jgi:hypothetical protein
MLSNAHYSPKVQGVADLVQRLARIDAYVATHSYRHPEAAERSDAYLPQALDAVLSWLAAQIGE